MGDKPCGCGGGSIRQALTVTRTNGQTTVERTPVPGMPRYRVSDSSKGTKEFATYQDARIFKASFGGKLRAI